MLAHELSHIGNRDILVSTIVVVMAGLVAILSDIILRMTFYNSFGRRDDRGGGGLVLLVSLVAAILAPIAAMIIQLAVSRKREFLADASGALLTRYPEGLASALQKISSDATPMRVANNTTAHLWLDDPFKGSKKTPWLHKLFMTHPPIEERVTILRGMKI